MKPSALTALLLALALVACDDDEHTSNLPPDLRMEDVVGCWNTSEENTCKTICYDPNWISFYQLHDSSSKWIYETSGKFYLAGNSVVESLISASSNKGTNADSMTVAVAYRRVGSTLNVLNSSNDVSATYQMVDLAKGFPCGKPFTLLPKPANWTLF